MEKVLAISNESYELYVYVLLLGTHTQRNVEKNVQKVILCDNVIVLEREFSVDVIPIAQIRDFSISRIKVA